MFSMTVQLPEGLREFLERRAAECGLDSAASYLVILAREACEREAQARGEVEATLLGSLRSGPPIEVTDAYWEEKGRLLIEGLESGPAVPMTPEFWAEVRSEVRERRGTP